MAYKVVLTAEATSMLRTISDRRIQRQVVQRIERLAEEPEKQGKQLTNALAEYRSVRAVGQRYRIIYRVDRGEIRVIVIALGLRRDVSRRDVYALAQRLVRQGLIEPQEHGETE